MSAWVEDGSPRAGGAPESMGSERCRGTAEIGILRAEPPESCGSWKGSVRALGLFALLSLWMLGPHILPPTRISTLPYAHEDSRIFLWGFWWIKHCLLQWQDPYWTDFLFYPLGTSLAFHTLPLPYGLLSVPIQRLIPGVNGLVVALNSVIFLSFVLSGFGAYRLSRYVTGSEPAALISGLLFAFMPYHFLNMSCVNLLAIEVLPFYLLSLLKLRRRPGPPQAFFLALGLALAFYTSLEYALYLLLCSVLWLAHEGVFRRGDLGKKFFKNLALASLCFLLFAGPLLSRQVPFVLRERPWIEQDLEEVVFWSPAALSFILPSRAHPLYGDALSFFGDLGSATTINWGMRTEACLGVVSLLLGVFSLTGLRKDHRGRWALAALGILCLSLGPTLRLTGAWLTGIPMPYLLLYKYVPFFQEGRDPTRLVPLGMLMLSVLAAFGVRDLLSRMHGKRSRFLLAFLIGGLILFEDMPGRADGYSPGVNPVYERIGQMREEFAVIDLDEEPRKLLPQTVHGKKITYIEKIIPRSPSRKWMLPVEYDFRFPEAVLNLETEARASRMRDHRTAMRKLNIRYVLFPSGDKSRSQTELAIRLGGRVSEVCGIYLCAFEHNAGKGEESYSRR